MDSSTVRSLGEVVENSIDRSRSSSGVGGCSSCGDSPRSPGSSESRKATPQSPSSIAVRRRAHHPEVYTSGLRAKSSLRRDGQAPFLFTETRAPSSSTITAVSESVSYSSDDDLSSQLQHHEHHQQQREEAGMIAASDGLEWMPKGDPRSTVTDLEMGNVTPISRSGSQSKSSRRHLHSHSSTPPSTPSVSSSISTSSFRSRRSNRSTAFEPLPLRTPSQTDNNNSRNSLARPNQSPSRNNNNASISLRASLDAGMAAIRSWIRARPPSASNIARTSASTVETRQRSRSVTWQPASHASSTAASLASTTQEELDELLQPDEGSVSSCRTEDSHVSPASPSNRYRPASAPTLPMMPYHRHRPPLHPRPSSIQADTILEETGGMDEAEPDSVERSFLRQRSQSEPDGRTIPNFLIGPPPTTRYHTNQSIHTSHTSPRQRRRYNREEGRRPLRLPNRNHRTPRLLPNNQGRNQPHHSPFTRRVPRLESAENEVATSQQLSSSAAAALSDNPNLNASLSSFAVSEFSDAEASVGTATTMTAAVDSAFELSTSSYPTNMIESSITVPGTITPIPSVVDSSSSRSIDLNAGDALSTVSSNRELTTTAASPIATAQLTGSSTRISGSSGEGINNAASAMSQVNEAERQARIRWIRINHRFQFVITVVALIFSLLLFAILICWVALTSTYFLAFDKSCDVPLKRYYWLVTLQLVLDVFRNDIMRIVFRWDSSSNQRVPCRVIAYNITYLVYALLVLRLGIHSVFIEDNSCQNTAPELYNASTAFVSLSVSAWATIVCGYLIPFCVVAALLTFNGYNPTSQSRSSGENVNRPDGVAATQPVFPAAYATTGAPPGTIDRLSVVRLENLSNRNVVECCICMEDLMCQDVLVETPCKHIFHKHCCREWLRQARTCPFCRTDIPESLQVAREEPDPSSQIPIGPTGRPVVGLYRIIRRTTGEFASMSNMSSSPGPTVVVRDASSSSP